METAELKTFYPRHPSTDDIAMHESAHGTDRRISALHNSVGCSGYKRTMRGHRESVEDDPSTRISGLERSDLVPGRFSDVGQRTPHRRHADVRETCT
jgi:hypothetical protein